MKKELEWVRQNPKGRQAKSKARLARFEELLAYEHQKRNETQEIFIPVAERLGDEVIEFKNVSKGFGDRLLIDDLSFKVPPGAIVGIIGPNGAGKSTLFRMITGKEKPDSGEIKIGHTVEARVRRPERATRCRTTRPLGGRLRRPRHPHRRQVRDAVARLPRPLQLQGRRPAEDRRQRCPAASAAACIWPRRCSQGGNVLLLDEPSNDLDVETLRALEDALLEFAGSVLVISHDRWFLDRIATHILAVEGDSQWTFFDGNYQEYEADKKKRLGEEGAKPKRLRFRPIQH